MKNLPIIILMFFLISCQTNNDNNKLIGKWIGYENDSIYVELWFNESYILSWNEVAWFYEVLPYQLNVEDSLIKMLDYDSKDLRYTLNISKLEDDKLALFNDYGKWILEKIDSANPIIEHDNDSIWAEIGNRNGFIIKKRNLKQALLEMEYFNIEPMEVKIDSQNSGITRNLREINPIQDSIQINFDGYFYNTPVVLIHNGMNVYRSILQTDESTGFSTSIKFKRGKVENNFDLLVGSKRFHFTERNIFNFIHVSDTKKGFGIVYTNKGYIYD